MKAKGMRQRILDIEQLIEKNKRVQNKSKSVNYHNVVDCVQWSRLRLILVEMEARKTLIN